jgi:photosystem II stability/assembly factor-like uncharacterized protein
MKILIFISIFLILSAISTKSVESNRWKKVYSSDIKNSSYSVCLSCADSLNCIAFLNSEGCYGNVIKTTDGGINWFSILDTSIIRNLYKIQAGQMINKNTYFLNTYFYGNHVLTTDGGLIWQNYKSSDILFSVSFLKNGIGIATSQSKILYTDNDGISWDTVATPSPCMHISQVFILSDSIFTCFGFDYTITKDTTDSSKINITYFNYFCRSDDRGLTWNKYHFDHEASGYFFIDSLRGWVTAMNIYYGQMSYDLIEYTNDGGKTWTHQLDTIFPLQSQGLSKISFFNSSIGAAIGYRGKIVITHDGGKNWSLDTTAPFYGDDGNAPFANYVVYLTEKRFLVLTCFNANIYLYDEDGFPENDVPEYSNGNYQFKIFPNPTNNYCNISFKFSEPCQFKIETINTFGENVFPEIKDFANTGKFSLQINLSGIAPGVYFVVLDTGKERYMKKFVKVE